MLAWFFSAPCLIPSFPSPAVSKPSFDGSLYDDSLRAIFSQLDYSSLSSCCTVSRRFGKLALSALQSHYGIKCNDKIYLYYTTVLHKFDMLQAQAFHGRTAAEAEMVLQGSPEYMHMKAVLEADFGFCTSHLGHCIEFKPKQRLLELLNAGKKASAVPYLLDKFRLMLFSAAVLQTRIPC